MAKRTLKSVEENLIAGIKQAVVDIDAGETDAYMALYNQGIKHYLINLIGSHALLYRPQYDTIVLVWGLRTEINLLNDRIECSWGNGVYFDLNGNSSRFDFDEIAKYVIDRI